MRAACLVVALSALAVAAVPATAGQDSVTPPAMVAAAAPGALPADYDGPPVPIAPATMARDAEGRVTVRAVRLDAPLRFDGRLDEPIYAAVAPMSDFIQIEPSGGQPGTNKTDVWVFFDNENVYVSIRNWEEHMDRIVATEMRHDNATIYGSNDSVGFSLDTFYDRRNGHIFWANSLGGRTEGQFTNERQYNGDWNGIWDVKTSKFEGGWSIEGAIPFKSLRYSPGRAQTWGFQVSRLNFWKNEISLLTRIPPEKGPGLGMMMASRAATLVGIEAPAGGKNLDIKPYAISELTSDTLARPAVTNDLKGDIGVDAKYGVTQNMTLDLTYNTDFAQVEADEQQVNLTRFNLFFPEKREFFLENAGTFTFGGSTTISGGNTGDTPVLFYSRRIGLNGAREVPLVGGGRLTGRAGRYNFGIVNIQSDEEPVSLARATNFSVLRLKRDILRRSAIGLLYTARSVSQIGQGRNDAFGVDGTFTFFTNVNINTYWARTRTSGLDGDDASYRAQLDYAADRYGVQLEQLRVGDNFNPEVGFVRRDDMRRSYAQLRFSPRPKKSRTIRKFWYIGTGTYIENGAGRVETRVGEAEFDIDLQNSDKFTIAYAQTYEFVPRPFVIASGVIVPVGGYDYGNLKGTYKFGQQRPIAGTLSIERGSFYDGDKTTVGVSGGRVKVTPHFSIEPTTSINRVDLPWGAFTTTLLGSRVTYTATPLMFVSALLQYNSGTSSMSSNVRLRWEYRPGSELFVVYNEQRDTLARAFPDLANRAFIVKVNRLLRF